MHNDKKGELNLSAVLPKTLEMLILDPKKAALSFSCQFPQYQQGFLCLVCNKPILSVFLPKASRFTSVFVYNYINFEGRIGWCNSNGGISYNTMLTEKLLPPIMTITIRQAKLLKAKLFPKLIVSRN